MDRLRSIFECIFGAQASEPCVVSETFSDAEIFGAGTIRENLEVPAFTNAFKHFREGTWTLSVTLKGQDAPHYLSVASVSAFTAFIHEIEAGLATDLEASATLRIRKLAGENVDIFDLSKLESWIDSLAFPEMLSAFNTLVADNAQISFVNSEFSSYPSTRMFIFSTSPHPVSSLESRRMRAELLLARREQVTSDWSAFNLFPDDFCWLGKCASTPFGNMFGRIENFLAVVSLADSTLSCPKGFSLRVKGHVLREQALPWNLIPKAPDTALRNLFQWCYRSGGAGPLSDKLGLLRNYMSLYWNGGIFGQDLTVVAAVRSGFSLYLKRNLKEFVELRAKVAAFLLELDAKATKAVESATSNLERNLFGVVTFVTSVVLLKALQDKSFSGAFSPQVAVLGYALVAFSGLHAFHAWWSCGKEMERASQIYSDLRKLYSAFFTESDFDSIFSSGENDETAGRPKTVTPIARTKAYVRSRLKVIMLIWLATLFIAACVIRYLT